MNFVDSLKVLIGFCLLVEEARILISNEKPKASRFLLPIFFFFSAGPVKLFLKISFLVPQLLGHNDILRVQLMNLESLLSIFPFGDWRFD